ncbi:HAD family hydrolase [Candidatus Peregrinibacteria bacterium]|nr:MAG: HAD family hydrolase [Candidatus Peregrinibacteria bacterium]
MNTKAILFDLDGTITDTIPIVLSAFQKTFHLFSLHYPGDDILRPQIGRQIEHIFGDFFSEELIPKVVQIYREQYLSCQKETSPSLFSGVFEGLFSFSKCSLPMGIVTTKLRSFTLPILERFEIDSFFSVVVGAEDVEHCKPHPEPLLFAAKKLNVLPEECLYIGDSLSDAKAAISAGMPFFGVLTGVGEKEELLEYGEVFLDLQECSQKILSHKKDYFRVEKQ